jgi:hypothetical protein
MKKVITTIENLSDDELKKGYNSVLYELLSFPNEEDLKATQKFMEFEIIARWINKTKIT